MCIGHYRAWFDICCALVRLFILCLCVFIKLHVNMKYEDVLIDFSFGYFLIIDTISISMKKKTLQKLAYLWLREWFAIDLLLLMVMVCLLAICNIQLHSNKISINVYVQNSIYFLEIPIELLPFALLSRILFINNR